MAELQQRFPEIFEPLKRSRLVKHSVVAKFKTVIETPVWSYSRRLDPDKLAALTLEINRLISYGIFAKSHSEWSMLRIVTWNSLGYSDTNIGLLIRNALPSDFDPSTKNFYGITRLFNLALL